MDTKFLTSKWSIAPYDFRVDLNLRYLDGLRWRAEIKDVEGKVLHETKYGKRLAKKIKPYLADLKND